MAREPTSIRGGGNGGEMVIRHSCKGADYAADTVKDNFLVM